MRLRLTCEEPFQRYHDEYGDVYIATDDEVEDIYDFKIYKIIPIEGSLDIEIEV